MVKYNPFTCTYVRSGKVAKEGPNQGREFQIVQLQEVEHKEDQYSDGLYTHHCFVWKDEYEFDVGSVYNCMIQENGGRSNLISVEE